MLYKYKWRLQMVLRCEKYPDIRRLLYVNEDMPESRGCVSTLLKITSYLFIHEMSWKHERPSFTKFSPAERDYISSYMHNTYENPWTFDTNVAAIQRLRKFGEKEFRQRLLKTKYFDLKNTKGNFQQVLCKKPWDKMHVDWTWYQSPLI